MRKAGEEFEYNGEPFAHLKSRWIKAELPVPSNTTTVDGRNIYEPDKTSELEVGRQRWY